MYNGLIPVPASSGFPVDGLRGARLNELLELRAEKKMLSWNISVTTHLRVPVMMASAIFCTSHRRII